MEVKKKFEKPQMEVVKLKPAYVCNGCSNFGCPDEFCEDCNGPY